MRLPAVRFHCINPEATISTLKALDAAVRDVVIDEAKSRLDDAKHRVAALRGDMKELAEDLNCVTGGLIDVGESTAAALVLDYVETDLRAVLRSFETAEPGIVAGLTAARLTLDSVTAAAEFWEERRANGKPCWG
jgi:hypothetical protein